MKASEKYPEKKSFSIKNVKILLERTNDEQIKRHREQNKVASNSMGKPVETVTICYVGMAIYISRAIPSCCLIANSELNYLSEYGQWNYVVRFVRSSGRGSHIRGGDRVVPLELFSPAEVGIYIPLFTSQSILLVEF